MTTIDTEKLRDASQDDLIAIIDSCERFNAVEHGRASEVEFRDMMRLNLEAVKVLKEKYKLDDAGIRKAWQEWNENTLRREYDQSACAQCPLSPGYEDYKRLGGVLNCVGPRRRGGAMVYILPKIKAECLWERKD